MSSTSSNQQDSATWIVGKDPCSNTLAVLPEDVVENDCAWIQFLLNATTISQLRENPRAAAIAKKWFHDLYAEEGNFAIVDVEDVYGENPPSFDELNGDMPFNLVRWFGDDMWYLHIPEARVQTGKLAPHKIIDRFGQPDTSVGLDYLPATWFQLDDRARIVAELQRLGHVVRNDDAALKNYYYFDYTG